ncbi:hypothetical protein HYALB_00005914 [Hymenoscyphus albidus]|uniref:Uncharacterized protein n=1 Tax=Hymenoscyphus albidus TaxID=595503 RepID=A0A9N9PXC0_9HELO|nr:hypothetical protein HYALB_00005914 [Hymenoscyphus albidus]
MEVLIDLGRLIGSRQFKLEKIPHFRNPSQVWVFPRLIEDWFITRGLFYCDMDITRYAKKCKDYITVRGDGKQVTKTSQPEFPYPKYYLFSHMLPLAVGIPSQLDGVPSEIIQFLRENPPTPDYKVYCPPDWMLLRDEPPDDPLERMNWVPEEVPFDMRDRRFAHRYYFVDEREKRMGGGPQFPQVDLRPAFWEGRKWVLKEVGEGNEFEHLHFTRGMRMNWYGVGLLPDI